MKKYTYLLLFTIAGSTVYSMDITERDKLLRNAYKKQDKISNLLAIMQLEDPQNIGLLRNTALEEQKTDSLDKMKQTVIGLRHDLEGLSNCLNEQDKQTKNLLKTTSEQLDVQRLALNNFVKQLKKKKSTKKKSSDYDSSDESSE